MTQFMICARQPAGPVPAQVVLRPIGSANDPALDVARRYFDRSSAAQEVVDVSGVAAPLVDEIWEKLTQKRAVTSCPLFQLLKTLFDERIAFVLWCSNDVDGLPVVQTWESLLDEMLRQAAAQPADVYLRFSPTD